MKPKRKGLFWSYSDVNRLRLMAKAGTSSRDIAAAMGRTPGAVRYKAMVEGVRIRGWGRKHSIAQKRRQRNARKQA